MKRSFRQTLDENSGASVEKKGSASEDEVGSMIKKYSGMSEDRLMRELRQIRDDKDSGIDESSVKRGLDAIMPMLNDTQKRRLSEIMGALKV